MGRLPGRATTRWALAAAAIGVTAVTAACGSQQPGSGSSGGSPAPGQPSASHCSATPHTSAAHTVTLSGKDNGTVLCVKQGTFLAIYLQGTAARKWSPIRASSRALQPLANGRLMLKLGVTGGFFKAAHPGVAAVTSSRPSCPSPGGGFPASASSGPRCRMGTVFHVTFVISS